MKKVIISLLAAASVISLYSQDTTAVEGPWKATGMFSLNMSQVALSNWSQGGESSYALNTLAVFGTDYTIGKSKWANLFDIGYGVQKVGANEMGKTDDHFEVTSRYGYQTSKNWFLSGMLNVKSQFTRGYNSTEADRILISDFMSPGYILISLGMEYKPNEVFTATFSPVSGKLTIVTNDSLSQAGSFGVNPGENMRSEFGGNIKVLLTREIMKNVTLTTSLDLFSNYIDNPLNIDVSWKLLLNMKVNEFLSANISTHLLYDDDINYTDNMGVSQGPRVQFKEMLGIGLSVKF
ncbi:MAG: DUF3078 domain-containing protein [Bacteroidia bacterium]|nr:MAG: DUF3078 domain-containing protein [Bacteroidia bacterium]